MLLAHDPVRLDLITGAPRDLDRSRRRRRVSLGETVSLHEGSLLWTLEEISRLVSHSGSPAETLTNIVHLIRRRFDTDVCSVYLLEPDRSSLVLAATIGLRPESVGRIRMRLTEGLAGLVAEEMQPQVVADATGHPRFKYFGEAGEDPYHSFLGVPLIDHGLLQGVLVVQTIEPRTFAQHDVRMLVMAGTQLAPIVSEARTLGLVVAPTHQRLSALAQNLWWSWDDDATNLFRQLDPALWRETGHNPVALLRQMSIEKIEERVVRARAAQPDQLRLPPHAGVPRRRSTRGAIGTPACSGPVRSPTSPPSSGCTNRCRSTRAASASWPGDHVKSASDLGIPLIGVGLYYDQGYFKQRLDRDGWQQEEYLDVDSRLLPIQPADRQAARR